MSVILNTTASSFIYALDWNGVDYNVPSRWQGQNLLASLGLMLFVSSTALAFCYREGNALVKAPFCGSSVTWLARLRFLTSARSYVDQGYARFRHSLFKLSGNDMIIIPAEFVEYMRTLPDVTVDAIKANTDNFQGVYSATSILNEGNLHNFVLQTKLTPKLSPLVPIVRRELAYAIEQEFPNCSDEWAQVKGFDLLIRIISRVASRLFVGEELCRDPFWLATSRGYTENAFKTIIALRVFPRWMRPLVSCFLPYSWQVLYHLRNARKLLIPLIHERRVQDAQGKGAQDLKFTNLLKLMDDAAQGPDKDPDGLARRTLVLTLASSHTTSMAACQALYELCYRPEYIAELRAEVEDVIRQDGGWQKGSLTKMRKLDSFMKESQRFHPPSLLGFKRNILQPVTLPNGEFLPAGAHTLMPIAPHCFEDPRLTEPEVFDGLRYYKMRQDPQYQHRLQFATTDKYTLHFGHGRHACPGRFLASNTIKMVLGQFLLDYEFRFPSEQGRPADVPAHEYLFPNPEGLVQFRKRRG